MADHYVEQGRVETAWMQPQARPEWMAAAVIVASWIVLAVVTSAEHATTHDRSARSPELGYWLIMTIAMMGPAALPAVRHVAINSLIWRRVRAVFIFSIMYVGIWTIAGVVVLALHSALSISSSLGILSIALAAAATWQLSPLKQRSLQNCHRNIPLPATGWAAERAVIVFGLRQGLACVGSCWCVMLALTTVPTAHLWWMLLLTSAVTWERYAERPALTAYRVALMFAVAAFAMLLFGMLRS